MTQAKLTCPAPCKEGRRTTKEERNELIVKVWGPLLERLVDDKEGKP